MSDQRQSGQPVSPVDATAAESSTAQAGVVAQAVAKIREDSFLFVVAIAALLGGVAISVTGTGPAEFRSTAAIVGALAFVAIVGYYLLAAYRARGTRPALDVRGRAHVKDASGEARVGGVTASRLPQRGAITGDAEVGRARDKAKVSGVSIGDDGDK